jgi:antitoxin component YwqK of YwqJK toxin-antitoxin module
MKTLPPTIIAFTLMLLVLSCQRTRTEKFYYPGGSLMSEVTYKGTLKHGISTYYFEDGHKEILYPYVDGELTGTVTRWYYNGAVEFRENYQNNLLDGKCSYFSISGKLTEEKNYTKGILDGPYLMNWDNGAVKINGYYEQGLFAGKWEYFDEQGLKVGEASFKDGNGTMTSWHRNGNISRIIPYRNNLKEGREQIFDTEGNLIEEHFYSEGVIIR